MLGIYPTDILANIYLENPFNRIIALKIFLCVFIQKIFS